MTDRDRFEQCWKRFETLLRGKLLERAKQEKLTQALANIALADAASDWFSPFEMSGAWLKDFTSSHGSDGKEIGQILYNMRFGAEVKGTSDPGAVKYAFPVAAALIGGIIASKLGATAVITAVAAVAPGAAAVPIANHVFGRESNDDTVNGYIRQLSKYHEDILALMESNI